MAELVVGADPDAVIAALRESDKSLNWARENCGLPRRQSDSINAGGLYSVPTPAKVIRNMGAQLNKSPFGLTHPGEFRKLALLNADKVAMIELCAITEPYEEVIAERTTLEGVRREIRYHKEQWLDTDTSAYFQPQSSLGANEAAWLESNKEWLCPPTIAWEDALPNQQVAAAGAILRKIDEEIRSKPQTTFGPSGPQRSMEHLVSRAEKAIAEQETIAEDLLYPKQGFAIFKTTVTRQLKISLSMIDERMEETGELDEDGHPEYDVLKHVRAEHKFSTPCLHVTHYLVVAPHDADFVYLTVPPLCAEWRKEEDSQNLWYTWFQEDHDRLHAAEDGLRALNEQASEEAMI